MKDDRVYLLNIIECIEWIQNYTSSGEEEFMKSRLVQDAVNRNLEIIGEATKRISVKLKEKNMQIPWRQMAGLRDVLIRDYMGVNTKTVWNVVQNELPQLLIMVKKLISTTPPREEN